jgi:hypothetical protein
VHAVNCGTNSFPRINTDYVSGCGYIDISFVDFGEDVFFSSSFWQHLSVYDALMTARGAGVTARVLAWTEQDVFAVEIDDQRQQPAPINIDLRMLRFSMEYVPRRNFELASRHEVMVWTNAHTATSRLNILDNRIALTQAFEEDEYYSGSAVVIAVSGTRAKARYLNDSTVRLSAAPGKGPFTVLIASASSYARTEDVAALAGKKLDAALAESFTGLMAASSRGPYPPRFGGMIWNTTGDMRQWGSEHWWNNDGAYYEGLLPANGKIYPDIAKETPYIIVKVEPHSQR